MSTSMERAKDPYEQSLNLSGNGLDESGVLFFINSLIEQNSDLASKLEQAESIIKLAVEGAHHTAQQVQSARAEADKITAEAKQIAESSARGKLHSAAPQAQATLKAAREKAEAIIKSGESEASRIIHEAKQKAESTKWQAKEVITAAEAKAREIKVQAEEEALRIALEAKTKAEKEALLIKQEAEQILEKNKAVDNNGELKEVLAAILSQLEVHDGKQPSQESKQAEIDKKEQFALYNGTVEIEIPPPISMNPLRDLARYLKSTRQIEVLALNSTSHHGLRMKLFLHNPLPLIKILKSLPQVEGVSGEFKKAQDTHYPQRRGTPAVLRSIMVKIKR